MHKNHREQLSAVAKTISLSAEEKVVLRSELVAHIRDGVASHGRGFSLVPAFFSFRLAAAGLFGVLCITSSVVYAAEHALPGDILYPIKVGISERLRTLAAVSYEAQAEWSVTRTTRRLQELEQLATTGMLDEKARDEITSRFEKQASEAHTAIVKLKTERMDIAANTSSQLESSLRIHERVLMRVAEEREDLSSQLRVILDTVRKNAEDVSEIRLQIEKELAQTHGSGNDGAEYNGTAVLEEQARDALSSDTVKELDTRLEEDSKEKEQQVAADSEEQSKATTIPEAL